MEEPGGLQSTGSQTVRYDLVTSPHYLNLNLSLLNQKHFEGFDVLFILVFFASLEPHHAYIGY